MENDYITYQTDYSKSKIMDTFSFCILIELHRQSIHISVALKKAFANLFDNLIFSFNSDWDRIRQKKCEDFELFCPEKNMTKCELYFFFLL